MNFLGEILIRGFNPYVLVSREQAERIKPGWRKPLPVVVRINGQPSEPWHINMMPRGDGSFYLYLHNEVRVASNTKVGDIVSVDVKFDTDYRGGPQVTPGWFTDALTSNPIAKANWERLSPSRQKEVVRYIANLKSAEAQSRNLKRAIWVLSGKEGRFIGRSWRNGA